MHSLELLLPVAQIGVAAAGFRCTVKDDAAAGKGVGQHIVDLVEGEPILDFALVAADDRLGILFKGLYGVAAEEAAVLLGQMQRSIKMGQGDQRLNAVLVQLVEHCIVELQALFVGDGIITVGEDAAPADAHAEHLEAHLGEQFNVVLIGMIEIDAAALGQLPIFRVSLHVLHHFLGGCIVGHMHIKGALGITDLFGDQAGEV